MHRESPIVLQDLRAQITHLFRVVREYPVPVNTSVEQTVGSSSSTGAPATAEASGHLVDIALDLAPEGILIIRPQLGQDPPTILFANQAFCRMSGADHEAIVGQQLEIFRVSDSDEAMRDALLHPLCQRRAFEGEAAAVRRDGTSYYVELTMIPVHDGSGGVVYWIAYVKDISERRKQLQVLERQALHDVLTQLPNRTLLLDRVDQAIIAARRTATPVALMVMDLNGFKEVNDTFGHHAGDLLLQQLAPRLKEQIEPTDTVARLGGDEFAFVLPNVRDDSNAVRQARKIIKALETPFHLEDQKCEVGASIGVALFPDHGDDASLLLRRADRAMYHAKRTSRGVALYTQDFDRRSHADFALGVELRQAIESEQLRVYYQPKIHLRSGLVTRVEALVRWEHPEKGLLVPDQFIPIAERTGLIKPLTDWVLDRSLEQASKWRAQGLPVHIAVNLSTRVLLDSMLPQTISSLLDKWNLEARTLKVEITESSIMADPPHALAVLSLLQTLGVRLSLDDFGTGYSSLMHLRQLPVDEIKIDKSFVMGMATSAGDVAIVRATIELGHSLGRQVVAEGVDDPETCRVLDALGCDLAQGYSFSPPLPALELERWLRETAWGFTAWRKLLGPR